eukprot:scaffold567353_cov36-Prasinocladus_malaysianus.AAC.1
MGSRSWACTAVMNCSRAMAGAVGAFWMQSLGATRRSSLHVCYVRYAQRVAVTSVPGLETSYIIAIINNGNVSEWIIVVVVVAVLTMIMS